MNAPVTPGLYCYNEHAKQQLAKTVRSFFRRTARELPEFTLETHFNPGGIAVWGEVYAKFYRNGAPIVEAYNELPLACWWVLRARWTVSVALETH